MSFIALHRWEGTVLSVEENSFTCLLKDLMHPESSDEVASLPIQDVQDEDLSLLAVGAVFYYEEGYFDNPEGGLVTLIVGLLFLIVFETNQMDKVIPVYLMGFGLTQIIYNFVNPKERPHSSRNYNKILMTFFIFELIIYLLIR